MTVRHALEHECASIVRLVLLAIQDIAYQLTGFENESDVLDQLEKFYMEKGNRFSRDCFLVKEAEGVPAGMILCYHGSQAARLYEPIIEHLRHLSGDDSIVIDQEADDDEYYIDALAVHPNDQGKGYAKQLIEAAELEAIKLQYRSIALNVDQDNSGAHRLYLSLGYEADKVISIHHKPYWHMTKTLVGVCDDRLT